MKRLVLLPLLLVSACFDASNAPTCTIQCATDADCTEGQTCGAGNLCTDGANCIEPESCTPNEFIACVNDQARSCNATGDGTTDATCGTPGCNSTARRCNSCLPDEVRCGSPNMIVEQCASDGSAFAMLESCNAGCIAASGNTPAHCAYISPAWIADVCDAPATTMEYRPNASATITTSLDTNCDAVIAQTGGSPICVVRAKTITIPPGITLTLEGTRPIAYVADTSLDVMGTLDAAADGTSNGPGGGRISGVAATTSTAGGGAGFGTAGANGSATGSGTGGAGGAALDPITLAAFAGGSKAATGTNIFDPGGGGGGGAVMLVACRGTVNVSGTIDAGGGGGSPQFDTILGSGVSFSKGAAGGGTGGYVVIQGLAVTVAGGIFANGGGGGGGCTIDDGNSTAGSDGLRSQSSATGGAGAGAGATGGRGGSAGTAPLSGGASSNGSAAGAGGGAVGVLQIYTPMGVTPTTSAATVSPPFTAKKNSTLR